MKRQRKRLACMTIVLCAVAVSAQRVYATGITADVGLTPSADRWIFRSQLRYMQRDHDPTAMDSEMEMYMVPVVLAYGVSPRMTAIVRQPFFHREMEMASRSMDDTGVGDLAIIGKYRALRVNRPEYIFGVAPILGVELPTGDNDFGSDTWDVLTGVYMSGRRGPVGADLNLEYKVNGAEERNGDRQGDEFTATAAVAYQFSLNDEATMSLWPVLEITYSRMSDDLEDGHKMSNSGEDVVLLSPGLKYAYQSFMLELLIQFPLDQNQNGDQAERGIGGLVGIRYMF